jgi:hypothetical protein
MVVILPVGATTRHRRAPVIVRAAPPLGFLQKARK